MTRSWPLIGIMLISVASGPVKPAAAEGSGSGKAAAEASGKLQPKPMTPRMLAELKRKGAALEAETQRLRKASLKEQQTRLEKLRAQNPETYRAAKKISDRTDAINRIMDAYRVGTLDEASARKQLTPLVKEEAAETLAAIDDRITSLQQALEDMQQLKKDQDAWVKQQVDSRLGLANQSDTAPGGALAQPAKKKKGPTP